MKKRTVFFLVFVFAVSFKLYAPNLSDRDQEQLIWTMNHRLNRERVELQRKEELRRYLDSIGHMESGNNPRAWNRYGYIGKYQFGYAARKSCGYNEVKFRDFIRNPEIWSEEDQEDAMITLLSKNESHLRDVIHKYNGKVVKGTTITKSGILAAAHLAGAGGVKKYFYYGRNPKDAYGTSLEDYLIKFSGFNF